LEKLLEAKILQIVFEAQEAVGRSLSLLYIDMEEPLFPFIRSLQEELHKLDLRTSWNKETSILTVGWESPTG
ncbi:MAG: hypothetical protein AAB731_03280, partial [Patescibacteria group bacterium]